MKDVQKKVQDLLDATRETGQLAITDEEFNEQLHQCTEAEIHSFEKQLTPKLVIIARNGFGSELHKSLFAFMEFPGGGDPEAKARIIRQCGKTYYQSVQKQQDGERMMPVAVFLSTEAWIKTLEANEKPPEGSLEHLPDKNEAVVVVGLTVDKRTNTSFTLIHRSKQGVPMLGKTEYLEATNKDNTVESYTNASNGILAQFYVGFNMGMMEEDELPASSKKEDCMIDAKYLAVGLVWVGVGLSAFGAKEQTPGVALCAFLATLAILR